MSSQGAWQKANFVLEFGHGVLHHGKGFAAIPQILLFENDALFGARPHRQPVDHGRRRS